MNSKNRNSWPALAFLIACALLLLTGYTMEKVGVPRNYVIAITAVFTVVLWAAATLSGGTTRATKFFFAEHAIRPPLSAAAIAGCLLFPLIFMQAGAFAALAPGFLITLGAATVSGIALGILLTGARFRATGFSDPCELMFRQYQSRLPAQSLALLLIIAGLLLIISALEAVSYLAAWYFGLSRGMAIFLAAGMVILTAGLGGVLSTARLGGVAMMALLLALNLLLFFMAIDGEGIPIGQLSFGAAALEPMWDLEDQLKSLQFSRLSDIMIGVSPLFFHAPGVHLAIGILILLAIAAYPPMLQFYAASPTPDRAENAGTKAILLAGFAAASIVAVLVYSAYGFYESLLGLSVSEARIEAPVLFSWPGRIADLVTVCGTVLNDAQGLMTACPEESDHILSTSDLSVNARLFFAAAADFNGYPLALSGFLTAAAILALITFSASTALAMASNFTGAFYMPQLKATGSHRAFWSRLVIAALVVLAALAVHGHWIDPDVSFLLGMSIIASTALPALIAVFYLPQLGFPSVTSAISTGFTICVLYFVLATSGIDFVPANGDEVRLPLPGMPEGLPGFLGGLPGAAAAGLILVAALLIVAFQDRTQPAADDEETLDETSVSGLDTT
ncbi:hypothetical protein [Salaquimonas pukyongi]|uniref:hypothetical protein n=1 Tax=Salaquimonas pukyongi TaxID=2712698 RepID=UPI00096BB845|nr:hypothetical protein [Salaquimonas pukyongi]